MAVSLAVPSGPRFLHIIHIYVVKHVLRDYSRDKKGSLKTDGILA